MTTVKGRFQKNSRPIERALISVSDKFGLVELAQSLNKRGVELISTGGTAKLLIENGFKVTPIESVTGNPEAFSGRMKTISFPIASSLLFRRYDKDDCQQAKDLKIQSIDLVVCNLYPFEKVAQSEGSFEELIENIDIGGPSMLRAAAKNFEGVCVLSDPGDYQDFIKEFTNSGETTFDYRYTQALKTFSRTALYDSLISETLLAREGKKGVIAIDGTKAEELRYGENPHQKGHLIRQSVGVASGEVIQGKAMSYNNYLDADAAYTALCELDECRKDYSDACVVVKHANPCGAAIAQSQLDALALAWAGDPISSFGSIICFNRNVTKTAAEFLSDKFVEVVMAPEFEKDALELFEKKKNLRLVKVELGHISPIRIKTISGGQLIQESDREYDCEFQKMTKSNFSSECQELGSFATTITKHLKSNAISLVKKFPGGIALIGAGMGNPNRLVSTHQAIEKAKENGHDDLSEVVLVSDAFFPFADNVELAAEAGIRHIIQPGGSMRDNEVIAACDQLGVAMLTTGKRHFCH